ncbi:hypothetical protein EDB92DRAFT_1943606 [Lactarius akahatsu]|uniref:Choline/carnitine acyltransferase domain-containing protein n=1 Tax=Lactarius akahatsu TaxID=416441 RepID=A0AAD4LN26_9AGAM|nr:hypothetical protein EDB92DRAFT_1943606 [Lactarius akahatsu]
MPLDALRLARRRRTPVDSRTQESPKFIQQSAFAVSLNSSSLVKTHSRRPTLTYTTFVPQSIPIIDESLIANSDIRVLWFSDYGVERIPSIAGLPPDAYIQVAIQLARY